MRCFFHLVNGLETIPDDTGIEVADLETAKVQAQKAIGELRQEYRGASVDWSGWRLDIKCPAGRLLHSLDLNIILH